MEGKAGSAMPRVYRKFFLLYTLNIYEFNHLYGVCRKLTDQ